MITANIELSFLLNAGRYDTGIDFLKIEYKQLELLNSDKLFSMAAKHGLAPQLYYNLQESKVYCNPYLHQQLKNAYYKSFARSVKQISMQEEIVAILYKNGIKTVLLKGQALATNYYKDPALRPMGDIDILVDYKDLQKALKLLNEIGFINSPMKNPFLLKFQLIYNIALNRNEQLVELHWNLHSAHAKYKLPTALFIENSIPLTNWHAYIFSPEMQLIHLCVHTYHNFVNGGIRLCWFNDMYLVINKFERESFWKILVDCCNNWDLSDYVFSILKILKMLWGVNIPELIEKYHISNFSTEIIDNAIEILERGKRKTHESDLDYIEKVKLVKGFSNKCKYLFAEIFPSKNYIKKHFNIKKSTLLFPYYAKYIGQLFRKVARSIFKK